ncbi:PEP/pyruvate-binding domain-containing protein [Nonomuraea harbinensis]|uniref:Phosphoenolpyruvate synthase n=1 Tax=Nonomuraea harbinensis TaxID=1286938 RepID=A0ABW1C8C8_9ACTN|nr:PEP/pyruvate-binding domain-containing protein [Nonomuraea harbinensis]
MTYQFTLGFDDPSCRQTDLVGGKAAGLAEMTSRGVPVAPGFVVTTAAFREFLDATGRAGEISELLGRLERYDLDAASLAAERIHSWLADAALPEVARREIEARYVELSAAAGTPGVSVAIRSSASAEDSVLSSFAGEFETWVDVAGLDDVLAHVHKCYLSMFAPRVLSYVLDRGLDHGVIDMAVVVQKTVRARAAGVMFTLDPVHGDRSQVVIEANWGLGLSVVGGEVIPDRYTVDKVTRQERQRVVGSKRLAYLRGDRGPVEVPEDRRQVACLSPAEVLALADLGMRLEELQGKPQDIEFAVDEELPEGGNLVLLQCRPETVWSGRQRPAAFDAGSSMMSWIAGAISAPSRGASGVGGHHHG